MFYRSFYVPYTNIIAQKINFLAQGIRNEKESDNANIYIECYTTEKDDKPHKVVRFSTDLYLWTEIHPVDPVEGDILLHNVAINLFLVPLKNKKELAEKLDEKLKVWQSI